MTYFLGHLVQYNKCLYKDVQLKSFNLKEKQYGPLGDLYRCRAWLSPSCSTNNFENDQTPYSELVVSKPIVAKHCFWRLGFESKTHYNFVKIIHNLNWKLSFSQKIICNDFGFKHLFDYNSTPCFGYYGNFTSSKSKLVKKQVPLFK